MAGLNVYAADTDEEARRLFTTPQQAWANRFRGRRGPYPPPIDDIEAYWTDAEKAQASSMLAVPSSARRRPSAPGSTASSKSTGVDEVMVVTAIHDHAARVRSYEVLADAASASAAAAAAAEPGDKVSRG